MAVSIGGHAAPRPQPKLASCARPHRDVRRSVARGGDRRDARSRAAGGPGRRHPYQNRPIYITGDTFVGGRCSNGGALSSISVQWDVLNSTFTDNHAIGWGANPASRGTPGGGSGGAIYMDGTDDNALIAGTTMHGNRAREGGGAVFDVVDSGWGRLTFDRSHLLDNTSGEFQTFPGVYCNLDGHDGPPRMIRSTDR